MRNGSDAHLVRLRGAGLAADVGIRLARGGGRGGGELLLRAEWD